MMVEAVVSSESYRTFRKPVLDVWVKHCGFGFARKDKKEPQYWASSLKKKL
jgi:hypothetical protein